ncbi:MAG TPA: hypothetical protein VEW25_12305 [Allosphingosinicella sp.]|nr:hypothetical protein [Allosphingosinicella sp.]
MNPLLKLTAAAAALAGLTACDMLGLNREENAGANAATNAVAANVIDMNTSVAAPGGKDPAAAGPNAATAGFTPGDPVTPAFLVGRWTDNNDCSNTIEFRDDGSFILPNRGQGYWTLNGDRLTFQGASTVSAQVSAPNADTIMLTHPNGTVGRSTRCS